MLQKLTVKAQVMMCFQTCPHQEEGTASVSTEELKALTETRPFRTQYSQLSISQSNEREWRRNIFKR